MPRIHTICLERFIARTVIRPRRQSAVLARSPTPSRHRAPTRRRFFLTHTRLAILALSLPTLCLAQAPPPAPTGDSPVTVSLYDRSRIDAIQWFTAPPYSESYPYVESLLRIGIAQKIKHYDWQLELAQPTLFDLPKTSVAAVAAQGQLGLGGTYYASNTSNSYPVTASFKQGFLRYHFNGPDRTLRLGRFEFIDGQETAPKDPTLAWLQTNRIAHRLIGNFGFSNGQRSFDGIDGHFGGKSYDVTAFAGRADQGVYNMNANPELNVDVQYLAFSRYESKQRFLWRVFALDYHDGRTGLTKTDNRPAAARALDHKNIRLGTYGANFITTIPTAHGSFDLLAWGALQNGRWGLLNQHAGAWALEGGYKFGKSPAAPWLRGGAWRSTGDNNNTDTQHNTFFQVLPTPRIYARFPFFNLMNSKDEFVQFIDKPAKKLELRADLHFLQLTAPTDFWYLGGGAYDNKVFGFVGRPGNGHGSFATFADISSDYQLTKTLAVNLYYANVRGKTVVGTIYPAGRNAQFGYAEVVYRWSLPQRASAK